MTGCLDTSDRPVYNIGDAKRKRALSKVNVKVQPGGHVAHIHVHVQETEGMLALFSAQVTHCIGSSHQLRDGSCERLSLLGHARSGSNVRLMSRNSKAHNGFCTCSQRTSPSGQTHDTDIPDTTTRRRSRVCSEKTVPLKSLFDLKKSGTVMSEDGIRENRSHVVERLEQLGWEPAANLEKKSILHELEVKVPKSEMNDNPNVCAGLSQRTFRCRNTRRNHS